MSSILKITTKHSIDHTKCSLLNTILIENVIYLDQGSLFILLDLK